MAEQFKAGDRVEYRNAADPDCDPDNGNIGTVRGESEFSSASHPRVRVAWDDESFPANHPYTKNLRLVEPRKDTPKVGDIVRVVLEGKVQVGSTALDLSLVEASGWLNPQDDAVKSIEITKPAKPSVADLPVLSAVRVGPDVFVKAATNHWSATGRQGIWIDEEIDQGNWILLVEKGPE